ncbi:MAG: hypothetical protein ABIO70_30855 [Pseudomonadota bacterium]
MTDPTLHTELTEHNEERRQHQQTGQDLILLLYGLSRSVLLYEANNATIAKQIGLLLDRLAQAFATSEEGVRLQLLSDEFFLNGKLLRADPRFWDRAVALSEFMRQFSIGEISFEPSLNLGHLQAFVADLSRSARAQQNLLAADGYGPLQVGENPGQSLASFDFKPDRFTLLLCGSLLDVMEWFYQHREQRGLSVLPLRRTLQLVIDAAARDPAMFQVAAAIRDPRTPPSPSRLRLAATIDAICFGHYLTLHRREIMVLAVAAVLSGAGDSPDPLEAVRPLYRLRGIKDAAMPMALAVHDARATLLGQKGGEAGQVLATCEMYHELTAATETSAPLPPAEALRHMLEGAVPGLDRATVQTFADYKGPHPLGSGIKLSNGAAAVVVGQGEGRVGKHRPVVMLFDGTGLYGEPIDLAARDDIWIERSGGAQPMVNLATT